VVNRAIELHDVRYAWPGQEPCLHLRLLQVEQGETVFVHGPSGSGKSTLLSLLAAVLAPGSGRVALLGQGVAEMRRARRDRFRADHVGYIFQQFNLLPYLSVLRNVLLPCRVSRRRAARAAAVGGELACARALLEALEIAPSLWPRPAGTLSVGQQQRVAAARALIGEPELVIADEPTSALDSGLCDAFMKLLLDACAKVGSTVVFVSHDVRLADRFDRSIDLPALNGAAPQRP
jgi:putative ABC transport system ATP-binding protein